MDIGIFGLTFALTYFVLYIVLLVIRLLLVPTITISAYRNGRSVLFWGIFAMFFPFLALILFAFQGKESQRDVCYAWKDCAKGGKRK